MSMDPAEFATFMVADDANDIVGAINRLHGPIRATLVAHLQVLASTQTSVPENQQPTLRLLAAKAAPIHRASILKRGPLLSETREGRVIERKMRGHKIPDIAKAEFPEISAQQATIRVREIIRDAQKKGKLNAQGKARQRSPGRPWKRRPPEIVEPLKRRAVTLRMKLKLSTGEIAKTIGEPAFFVTRAIQEAKSRGEQIPEPDPKTRATPELLASIN